MYKLFSDQVINYQNKGPFFVQGSNPLLQDKLFKWIDNRINEIESIQFAWYLFNNPTFLNKLKEYASLGIKIQIISIPLEGYDDTSPQSITDYYEFKNYGNRTKFNLAMNTYYECKRLTSQYRNFSMFIFPHMYVRSSKVKPFSRGLLPYSLHIKSFNITYKDGTYATGLSSSNLAVRDEIKDNIIFVSNDNRDGKVAKKFFDDLVFNSIDINLFDENKEYFDFSIQTKIREKNAHTIFIAPFYENSPHIVRDHIIEHIKKAQKRIYICAQHISAYLYFEDNKEVEGIMFYIIEAARRGVEVNILLQTPGDNQKKHPKHRTPNNTHSLNKMIKVLEKTVNIKCFVNPQIHSKYIVIDDRAIITTCNFTPTQFIYIPAVNIPVFSNIPNVSYKGTFSEVGQFFSVTDETICRELINNFTQIIERKTTDTLIANQSNERLIEIAK